MKSFIDRMYKQNVSFKIPRINNDNKQIRETYVPFKREFEQNFLKLFGIIL